MKKSINGKVYDTGKSKKVGTQGASTLYLQKDGGLFILRSTWDSDSIVPLDADGQVIVAVRMDAERLDRLRWAAAQNRMSVPEYIAARL